MLASEVNLNNCIIDLWKWLETEFGQQMTSVMHVSKFKNFSTIYNPINTSICIFIQKQYKYRICLYLNNKLYYQLHIYFIFILKQKLL